MAHRDGRHARRRRVVEHVGEVGAGGGGEDDDDRVEQADHPDEGGELQRVTSYKYKCNLKLEVRSDKVLEDGGQVGLQRGLGIGHERGPQLAHRAGDARVGVEGVPVQLRDQLGQVVLLLQATSHS